MFMRIKYVCIRRFCHGVCSPPSVARNKKPRFSIGKYQQLKKESVNAEIQKLLGADAQILELKTVKIDALGRKLHNKQEIVRR